LINIPTIITLSRIFVIPLFIFIAAKNPFFGAVIFSLAAITDFFDGYIARRAKQVTKLGILLDPIADKLLVISALIVLVDMELVPAWIAIVIIAREFLVTGLRVVALSMDMVIPAETGGKIKVGFQIASIIILLLDEPLVTYKIFSLLSFLATLHVGIILLTVAMIIGLVSGVQYFRAFWEKL
jgi:CDP-diacylglycerol--glycerol-3-phosphate 3-phosphatidyltransferase